ncbi:Ail/Lom family outer membrane beta-barrel protein, partial [Escherichia coli]|nr:Ail/Lom family outer membrane beta-barrel protein [Escherichia coli]
MRKLYAAILSAAICLTVSGAPAWASEQQATLSAGYLHARTNAPGSDNLNGINVKYRYEFTDTLGLVTSFSYAGDRNRQITRYSDTRWHEDSVRNRWFSVMAGPSVRVNEWFPPSHAGTITVYEDSQPGTLNDFLGAMSEDDVRPEALRRFELMVEEAARHAEEAKKNAGEAETSARNAGI